MQTAIDFVVLLAGFVPFLAVVAAALFAFWILTKMIPSLDAWMHSTEGMAETREERIERDLAASTSYDQYI